MKTPLLILLLLLSNCSVTYAQVSKARAEGEARRYALDSSIVYEGRRNVYLNHKTNVIHLFMYADAVGDANLLLVGYPTTATDRNLFQIHLYTSSDDKSSYSFTADGSYTPTLVIVGTAGAVATMQRQDFAVVGPFTGQVVFTVKRNGGTTNTISTNTLKVTSSINASIGSGFVYSTLKNPTNIHGAPIVTPGGDSTLIADNATGKVTLTLMATLYPWGRNGLMMPTKSFRDHVGIAIGTTIASSTKNFQNLYLGLQYDFAVGGSVVAGIDIASRQRIRGVNYHDFVFGESKFTGKVPSKLYNEVGAGFFFGVQVDSRIFAKLFTTTP